ncbi:MAG TPA: Sec-independent protein translocase subunit TatA [Pedococcus sp.]|nr:Sec-independent protein translocase subunit TatA [Pedococcus sp.]
MPNIGTPEIIIIAVVLILLFGWKRLPDAARSVGRSMRIFKSEVNEMKTDGKSAASDDTVKGETVREAEGTSPVREDNVPKTDNQSGPVA